MTEFRFYHLQRKTLEQALPSLLTKVLERGQRALVLAGSEERVEHLNQLLWTWDTASFLPHGSARDGYAADQPIWLTVGNASSNSPNGAQVMILTDGVESNGRNLDGFTVVCDLFDGNDGAAVASARERWRRCKDAGHPLSYWQQSAAGGWERKA